MKNFLWCDSLAGGGQLTFCQILLNLVKRCTLQEILKLIIYILGNAITIFVSD